MISDARTTISRYQDADAARLSVLWTCFLPGVATYPLLVSDYTGHQPARQQAGRLHRLIVAHTRRAVFCFTKPLRRCSPLVTSQGHVQGHVQGQG